MVNNVGLVAILACVSKSVLRVTRVRQDHVEQNLGFPLKLKLLEILGTKSPKARKSKT